MDGKCFSLVVLGSEREVKFFLHIAMGKWMGGCNAPFKDCCGWMDGWMGGCNARCKDFLWMDGRVYVMAVLRIAI